MGLETYFFLNDQQNALKPLITCYAKLNFHFSDLRSLLPRRDTFHSHSHSHGHGYSHSHSDSHRGSHIVNMIWDI